MSKSQYKKPKDIKESTLKVVKLLVTFVLIAVIVMVAIFIGLNGFQAVLNWFVSKWACLVVVILLLVVTATWWILDMAKNLKKVAEDE